MQLIILCSGAGSRFSEVGFSQPKPMLEIGPWSFLEVAYLALKNICDYEKIYVTVLQKHIRDYQIDEFIREIIPDAEIIIFETLTKGPAESAYEAIQKMEIEGQITIADCDQAFGIVSEKEVCIGKADAVLFTFLSKNPAHSFVKITGEKIERIAEKSVISERAVAGTYVFREANLFIEYYKKAYSFFSGERFISQILEAMLLDNKALINCETTWHQSFGTPEELSRVKKLGTIRDFMMTNRAD